MPTIRNIILEFDLIVTNFSLTDIFRKINFYDIRRIVKQHILYKIKNYYPSVLYSDKFEKIEYLYCNMHPLELSIRLLLIFAFEGRVLFHPKWNYSDNRDNFRRNLRSNMVNVRCNQLFSYITEAELIC